MSKLMKELLAALLAFWCDVAGPVYLRRTVSAVAKRSTLKLFNNKPVMAFFDDHNDLGIVACDKPTCGL